VVPNPPADTIVAAPPDRYADVVVNVQETQTGRIMLGAGVNSDLGVTGQIIVDERNFDWRRFPTSVDDILNGKAFRGAGQGFRIEALPGRQFQRYMVQFTEPYLGGTRVSMNLSGYLYDRRFFDWDEQRLGGRFGLGYRLTPDLSLSVGVRGEQVDVTDPRVLGIPELDAALGRHDLYMGQVTLAHDTRDIPFAPTEGHLLELNYTQAFGDFDYPRGEIDYRKYFLLAERADGSGRHVLGFASRFGFTGSQTPIYENYFAGGHSTMRGFEFREASPKVRGVTVGGEFLMLGSLEYLFPITADDMLKGVVFTDFGTVEQKIEIHSENYRVALGAGIRLFIPAMGPAPIALDFAVPVARADTDGIENFSFFIGVGR
jgi:outer membrane protein insertion porin family